MTQPIITKEYLRILQPTVPSGFKKQGGLMRQMSRGKKNRFMASAIRYVQEYAVTYADMLKI